jgi:hypothetical protein
VVDQPSTEEQRDEHPDADDFGFKGTGGALCLLALFEGVHDGFPFREHKRVRWILDCPCANVSSGRLTILIVTVPGSQEGQKTDFPIAKIHFAITRQTKRCDTRSHLLEINRFGDKITRLPATLPLRIYFS